MSDPGHLFSAVVGSQGVPGLRRKSALNYNAYAAAELPNFAACVSPFILYGGRTYVGAQSGYRPWIGCLDRIYRTMTVSGSTLVSRNFPGPYSSDWSGGWSSKVETEYRGILRWVRLGPQNWKAPYFSSFSWDRRWRIEVANPADYDPEDLVWGAAIYEDGIEARSRYWGPRHERNSDGYSEFVGFGWEDWGEWYHVAAPPGGSGNSWWGTPNGTSVDATPTVLTWDFAASLDLGGGSEQVSSGSVTYTLSDEVDAMDASASEMADDPRQFTSLGAYFANGTGARPSSGRKFAAQSVTAYGVGSVSSSSLVTPGAIGTPSIVRTVYRIGVPRSAVGSVRPTARWNVVTRRNRTGGRAYYGGNASIALNLLGQEDAYTRFTNFNGVQHWVYVPGDQQAVGSYRTTDDEREEVEDPITEPEDEHGLLAMSDPSWGRLSWVAKAGTVFGAVGWWSYYGDPISDDEITFEEVSAWRFRVLVLGPRANYRIRYWRVTMELLTEMNEETGEWWEEKGSEQRTHTLENGFMSPEETWIQPFNSRDKVVIRDVTVERNEGGEWRPLTSGKSSGQFVLLYKLRRHVPWGWGPRVSDPTRLPWQQWRVLRYRRSASYERLAPPVEHCGSAEFSVEVEVVSTRYPGRPTTHVFERNEANYGGQTFPLHVPASSLTMLGSLSNDFIWAGYSVGRPDLSDYQTSSSLTSLRRWAETSNDEAYTVLASYFSQSLPDPEGEIVDSQPMSGVCSQEQADSPSYYVTGLMELTIPSDPTCSAFVEDVRLEPPPPE